MTGLGTPATQATAANKTLENQKGSTDPSVSALQQAYRVTFREYADQLNTLQGLIARGATGTERFQAVVDAVEAARAAHNCARDRLAQELMRWTRSTAAVDEQQIRKTARLLWEFAGRPQGTAERDWQRAEKLVRTAVAC
jgi:hypothetical protein